jgi:hypothetical protein
VGYGFAVIPTVYRTDATYGRLFKQPLRLRSISAILSTGRAKTGKP